MSEDNKDKGSNQDKINALEAELAELKSQEKIKKLNAEIDAIKKNSQTEEKEEVKTFSKTGETKKETISDTKITKQELLWRLILIIAAPFAWILCILHVTIGLDSLIDKVL